MKNITVSVDEETYRLSRIRAAEAGTSVSALVRGPGYPCRDSHLDFDQLQKLQGLIDNSRGGGLHSSENLPRSSLYR